MGCLFFYSGKIAGRFSRAGRLPLKLVSAD
jgi:hypothetical protein